MATPPDLAHLLTRLDEHEYVRFTAQWIDHANEINTLAPRTDNDVVDALVAAVAAYVGMRRDGREPDWTCEPDRFLGRAWHPGMFAYSYLHAPASFVLRGIIVEADSLISV